MSTLRGGDGSAGDVDYGSIGQSYASYRRPDARLYGYIQRALGSAGTVLNVGAGTGSYEPTERSVTAIEPSSSMRAQRPPHLSVAIDAVAEELPFENRRFDASMATFSIHQWTDLDKGLSEMRRVTAGPVVILTCDPTLVQRFWLNEYAADVLAAEARRYSPIERVRSRLGGSSQVINVPIPLDCTDAFNEAYYGRPECLLDDRARLACSAWSFVDSDVCGASIDHLRQDLASGRWDTHHGDLRTLPEYDGSLRLIVAV